MEITISLLKAIAVLQNNITLKEVIVVKVDADTVLMVLIKKQIQLKRDKLDNILMTYRIKVANTHHRIDIRYP